MRKNENHPARDVTPASGCIGQPEGMEPESATEGKGEEECRAGDSANRSWNPMEFASLRHIIGLILMSFFVVGCATFPRTMETERGNLTYGAVKANIIKGETTQADILNIFGSPNIITKNRDDDEVWNYSRMSFETIYGEDGGALILWGGSRAMAVSTSKTFDLIIIFDQNDIVKEYSIISASF